jgi:hypothetical protein
MRAHGVPNVVDHPALPQHVFHASPEIAHQQKALPPLEADGTK